MSGLDRRLLPVTGLGGNLQPVRQASSVNPEALAPDPMMTWAAKGSLRDSSQIVSKVPGAGSFPARSGLPAEVPDLDDEGDRAAGNKPVLARQHGVGDPGGLRHSAHEPAMRLGVADKPHSGDLRTREEPGPSWCHVKS